VADGQEVEGATKEERLVGIGVCSPHKGPSLYRGWGCTLPPLQASPRAAAKGEEGSGDQGWWGLAGPPNPNPGRPRAPLFSFSLMGFFWKLAH
jgi:hypothetical protein